jgi:NTE family protein
MKIGLALGVGGAKGVAHIGVIEALRENNIPIDIICGTSMGAIIGAQYALYKDIDKVKKRAREMITSEELKKMGLDLFGSSSLPRPFRDIIDFVKEKYIYTKGFVSPYIVRDDGLLYILDKLFGDANFLQTKIPFAAVAVDLVTGEDVVFKEGKLLDAIRASISITGIFPVVERENKILVDGGITSTVPIKAARELGADFIIASSLMGKLEPPTSLRTALHLNIRVDEIVRHRLSSIYLSLADVVISPEVLDVHWADFTKFAFCIKKGKEATIKKIPQIKREISLLGRIKRKFRYSKKYIDY